LPPEEVSTLKLQAEEKKAWENVIASGEIPGLLLMRAVIVGEVVNFGDGTGYQGRSPYPAKTVKGDK